jgi:hypothetical protein
LLLGPEPRNEPELLCITATLATLPGHDYWRVLIVSVMTDVSVDQEAPFVQQFVAIEPIGGGYGSTCRQQVRGDAESTATIGRGAGQALCPC